MNMIEQFKAARRSGAPIIAIRTFDPDAAIKRIQKIYVKGTGDKAVETADLIQWDCQRGWTTCNNRGQEIIDITLRDENTEATVHYAEHLKLAARLPYDENATTATNPILFIHNAQNYFEKPDFVQALWNLRDEFKVTLRTVVLLGPDFPLPPELQQDVLVLDDPLPTADELRDIVERVVKSNGTDLPQDVATQAVDALLGLAAFPAEQAVAMSLKKSGLNLESLWERKRQMIKQSNGLSVAKGHRFNHFGGMEWIKERFLRIAKGKKRPRVIIWIDEIEKLLAGAGGKADGFNATEFDQLAVFLSEFSEKKYNGAICVGVPGAAKSEFAKAFAEEIGVPCIKMDVGASKGSGLVGQAEKSIRQDFKIINAIAGDGGAFFIATSNDISVVKPELKRRFKKGIWFFGLPTTEEKKVIWDIYLSLYPDITGYERTPEGGVVGVDDSLWTGAEIETCVTTADEEGVTLQEAAKDIIPVAVSGKEQVETLYREAHGRYNAVGYPGVFDRHRGVQDNKLPKSRMIAVDEEDEA